MAEVFAKTFFLGVDYIVAVMVGIRSDGLDLC